MGYGAGVSAGTDGEPGDAMKRPQWIRLFIGMLAIFVGVALLELQGVVLEGPRFVIVCIVAVVAGGVLAEAERRMQ